MIDLYQGTLGLKHGKDSLIKSLTEYLIRTDEDLAYGVKEERTNVMIITGKNELENKIPTFYHPVIFEYKGNTYVAMDMRLFVSKPKDENVSIERILKDTNNGKIALYRLILTKMFLDNDKRFLLAINKSVFEMFSGLINNIYRNTTMDNQLLPYVSLGCNYHYNTFETEGIDCNDISRSIYDNVLNIVRVSNPDLLNKLVDSCRNKSIPNPSKLLGDLVDVISIIGEETRANKVTSDILIMALSRSFFAINASELAIAFVESKANTIAILYAVLNNSFQKKSIMYRTIDFGKRYNNMKEFLSVMDRVLKEQIIY